VALAACLLGLREAAAAAQGAPEGGDPLAAGRALFAEALGDEDAGRFRAALEKFERVRGVRDTAPIEYRIGTCHEGLGQPLAAYGAYRAALALGEQDPGMADVVRASRERLDALTRHIARLRLVLPEAAPPDTSVRVDDAPVGRGALAEPLALEPGTHAIVAEAAGLTPFRSQVTLPEGGEASVAIVLAGAAATPAAADRVAPVDGSRRTLGWVLLAAGGGLLAGSVATLLLRHSDIASLEAACPGGTCPASANRSDLQATHDRAVVEGPVAAALAAGGLAAAGVGVYFVLATPDSAGLTVAGSFR
jgi:hypothetical protein